MKNRVLPETFGSGRVGYPLPNGYGHPYLAALVASFGASWVTKKLGRKISMLIGGLVFMAEAIINAAALNITMLIIGRILLGIGVGFANQINIKSPNYLLFLIFFFSLFCFYS